MNEKQPFTTLFIPPSGAARPRGLRRDYRGPGGDHQEVQRARAEAAGPELRGGMRDY